MEYFNKLVKRINIRVSYLHSCCSIFKVRSRSSQRVELLHYIMLSIVCQELFSTISGFIFLPPVDSLIIISCRPCFVNCFFQAPSFYAPLVALPRRPLHFPAGQLCHITIFPLPLSTPFSSLF